MRKQECFFEDGKVYIIYADAGLLYEVVSQTFFWTAGILSVAASMKYLLKNRIKLSRLIYPSSRGIAPYLIPMPDPKEPNKANSDLPKDKNNSRHAGEIRCSDCGSYFNPMRCCGVCDPVNWDVDN